MSAPTPNEYITLIRSVKRTIVLCDTQNFREASPTTTLDYATHKYEDDIHVEEGETSVESVMFKVHKDIKGLQRKEKLYKLGKLVDSELVEMGDFKAADGEQVFEFPEVEVPSGTLFRGGYTHKQKYMDADGNVLCRLKLNLKVHKTEKPKK
eukprot:Colp12_sorted_trinity150504_noHs@18277